MKKVAKELLKNMLVLGVFFVVAAVAAHATGGSEWQDIWNKVKDYLQGYPGMIAAALFIAGGLVSFYRGALGQGAVAIIVAVGIFLIPNVAEGMASGTLF